MVLKFTHNDVLHVYAETFTEVDREWKHLYSEQVDCLIWLKGTDTPWAAFPMERLLKGA